MAYFPKEIMPKQLRRETQNSIPGYPLAYNATDYNRLHREIIAIEKFLVGTGEHQDENNDGGLNKKIENINLFIDQISNGEVINTYTGSIASNGQVPLPSGVIYTTNVRGAVGTGTGILNVSSTAGWPNSGILTKFNSNLSTIYCQSGAIPPCISGDTAINDFANQTKHITNQEYISYEVLSTTQLNLLSRGLYGSSVQAIGATDDVIIILGRASIMYSPGSFSLSSLFNSNTGESIASPTEICIEHTANLKARALITIPESTTPLTGLIGIGYSLSVTRYYNSISINLNGDI